MCFTIGWRHRNLSTPDRLFGICFLQPAPAARGSAWRMARIAPQFPKATAELLVLHDFDARRDFEGLDPRAAVFSDARFESNGLFRLAQIESCHDNFTCDRVWLAPDGDIAHIGDRE